ncbi:hypothetical protein G6L37_04180 [Agrobacterium rubi]|nr:hypothetical protein [Agrobacterium rubi]NTF24549.1 hypothetical protein [Agrobacterium rubi]
MSIPPRLVINICDRVPKGFIAFGLYDMTMPAAFAIRDGVFDSWSTGYIPPTGRVCMHIAHEARLAAWKGSLYSYDLQHMCAPFASSVERFGGAERLIDYLEARYAARSIRRHAESLMTDIEKAEFVSSGRLDWLAHPLTGEVSKAGQAEADGIPFAFAGMEAVWKGVDPRDLYEFALDRQGVPDAMEFLAASFSRPDEAVVDIEGLDDAVHGLRHSRDTRLFRKWINEWNAKQDVRMKFRDERKAVGFDISKDDAVAWCRHYLASAVDLERSVDALFMNP